ncbi:DinB family protein [Rossellomorea vietnamensis]|uniref:DinB family protein n=1 Tax=Rossellomorea vietnamensis TaxID=218284 RepID=A0ACD4C384_9BACI|nr:DinB family protein [Rossellomorea vietnamensis]UXH42872.1 DinB family protein [Rossellomorea vietnamensis]WQI94340.1 DinB family protein [Rossellomorea vietnamensis]
MKYEQIIDHYESFKMWLEELKLLSEAEWFKPMEEDKWSIAANIAHIIKWDQYSLQEILPYIGEGAELPPFPDFQKFNGEAEDYAHRVVNQGDLIEEGIRTRDLMITFVKNAPEDDFGQSFKVGDQSFTMEEFFEDFIGHDKHHQEQIEELVSAEKV